MAKRINKAVCHRFKKQRERDNLKRKGKQTRITDFFGAQNDANVSLEICNETDENRIEFFQVNNQKRIMSNEEITLLAQKVDNFCILGSEPSTYGFNVTGINTRHTLIQGAADRPRAYISCHKNLKAWPVENLCSRDVAVAIIDSHMARAGKLLVVSIYWDGRIETFPEEAREAAKLSREKNFTLVMGGDINARNTLYGSKTTDKRGKIIEDIMVEFDLETANRGSKPTCTAASTGSVIDATFVSGEKSDLICNWRVTNDETFSDHNLIRFYMEGPKNETQTRRKMNQNQKEAFTRATRGLANNLLKGNSERLVDVESIEQIATDIIQGLVKAHKLNSTQYTITIREKVNLWFDKDLTAERRKFRALKHIYEHSQNDPAKKMAWKKQEQHLTNLYKKAKKKEKEGSLNCIIDQEDMARLTKFAKVGNGQRNRASLK